MAGSTASGTSRTWRPRIAGTLVVLACVLTFIGLIGGWLRLVALESKAWSTLTGSALSEPAVRTQVSHLLVDRLFEQADSKLDLAEQLPPRLQPLAAPLMGLAQQAAYRNADRLLASPKFQEAWRQANLDAHAEVMAIIEGDSKAIDETNGKVELDLRPLLTLVADRVGLNPELIERIPAERAQVDLGLEEQLDQVRTAVTAIKAGVIAVLVLALVLLVGALWAGAAQRSVVARWIANGWMATGLVLLATLAVSGQVLVRRVGGTDAGAREALDTVWGLATNGLTQAAFVVIFLGLAIRLLLWVGIGTRRGRIGAAMERGSVLARDHHAAATAVWAVPLVAVLVLASEFVFDHLLLVALVTGLVIAIIELARRRAATELTGAAG